jgi:hypothetical protein
MPLLFWWKPNNAPVGPNDNRKDIGLELGGDDPKLTDGAAGRIELYEVGGTGRDKGEAESEQPRLLAAFHGKFHRNPKAKPDVRITFEISLGKSTFAPFEPLVPGFDPECIRGVDAFVFTFLNREFQVNFPFFLDTRSEGTFIELQAVAKLGEGNDATDLGRGSAVLNLRIRRTHEVLTTTTKESGGNETYTGKVVGNLILHHEEYLVNAASRAVRDEWPSPVAANPTPVPWTGPTSIPFQPFTPGDLKVILMNDLIEGLFSGDRRATEANKTRAKNKIKDVLRNIFTDAGFQGPNVFAWEDEPAAGALVASFRGAFSRRHDQWQLIDEKHPLAIPFWTFIVAQDASITSVGVASGFKPDFPRTQVTAGPRVFLLPYPSPIGSGNKMMVAPVRVRSEAFSPVNAQVDANAARLAIVFAHEVGHSLGLMHEIKIMNSGPYDEDAASPVMSIMSSSIDSNSFGLDMRFSNQAKVIWQKAFNVQPNWNNAYLRNKTWGDDWEKVDWDERKSRFFKLNDADGMTYPQLTSGHSETPPYAGLGSKVQRGTYVP